MKGQLGNGASDHELLVESTVNGILAYLEPGKSIAFVTRRIPENLTATLAFELNGVKCALGFDKDSKARISILMALVARASQGELTFLCASEIKGTPIEVAIQSDGEGNEMPLLVSTICHANSDVIAIPTKRANSLLMKVPVTLIARDVSLVGVGVKIGERSFNCSFHRSANVSKIVLGDECMTNHELTFTAIIGSIKMSIDDLMRMRNGSTVNLGNLDSLEAVFEVEGVPYAIGGVEISETGEVLVRTRDVF